VYSLPESDLDATVGEDRPTTTTTTKEDQLTRPTVGLFLDSDDSNDDDDVKEDKLSSSFSNEVIPSALIA